MFNLELDNDEGIVLQATEVERYGVKETSLNEMVLTNKNIICVYNKSTGMFSKPETVVEKIPLSTIKVVNDKPQVMIYDNDNYGLGLQILFVSGHREHFLFYDEKKELPKWEKTITSVIKGDYNEQKTVETSIEDSIDEKMIETFSSEDTKDTNFGKVAAGVSAGILSAVKGAVSSVKEVVSEVSNEFVEQKHKDEPIVHVEPELKNEEPKVKKDEDTVRYIYCSNCGEKLVYGSKFCNSCGTKIGAISSDNATSEYAERVSQVVPEDITERKNVYEGKLHKCPNCGDIIDAYETICESCGYEIRGRKATSSVRELQLKLEELHAKRPQKKMKSIFGQVLSGGQLSSTDEEIVSLIKNFSIPNTKEDIMEFMILASSNIDLKVYGFNRQQYQMSNPAQREISDAWLAKFEQAYQKAKISFGTTAEFQKFQSIYDKKNNEISKAKKKVIYIILAIIGGVILYFALMIALIAGLGTSSAKDEQREEERLQTIVVEIETALENDDYRLALMNADSLRFRESNSNLKEDWEIKRDYWIDKVIDEAAKDGVKLERPSDDKDESDASLNAGEIDEENTEDPFTSGFNDAMEESKKEIQKNVDEFYENLNGGETSPSGEQ